MKKLLFLFLFFLTLCVACQKSNSSEQSTTKDVSKDTTDRLQLRHPSSRYITYYFYDSLQIAKLGDKYGYADDNDSIVIEPQFEDADFFYKGIAAAKKDGHWGFIDKTGNFVIEPQYDRASFFNEGLAPVAVCINDTCRWGFVDHEGNFVIEPKYEYASQFFEGLAAVVIDDKFGYINRMDKVVIEPKYSDATFFVEGKALVSVTDSLHQEKFYIDKKGKVISQAQK